jgi:tRNASer (uridine44-2'-O)-methyltransferase
MSKWQTMLLRTQASLGVSGHVRLVDFLTWGRGVVLLNRVDLTDIGHTSRFYVFRCGNGLLTHILIAEGYDGNGIDLRARTSWEHYPDSSRTHLHVHAYDPTVSSVTTGYLNPGIFIIGNHADELTPWIPVLSTKFSASGYLSIPCCAWTFDARFERSSPPMFPTSASDLAETLNLGGDGSKSSSYSMYRIWLASLSLHCGWEVECENLRIPSTRNWAIIGELPDL